MTSRRRRIGRYLVLVVLGAFLLVALYPQPTPDLDPGPLWAHTRELQGCHPEAESKLPGAPYAPLGLVALAAVGGPDWTSDPSGDQVTRWFVFPDERSARAAANQAVVQAIRDGFRMQSAGPTMRSEQDAHVSESDAGQWLDDGWDPTGQVRFEVMLSSPSRTWAPNEGWSVDLRLEHTY